MTWMIDKNVRSEHKAKCASAEEDGRQAFQAYKKLSDNPHPKNERTFLAWAYGFQDAKDLHIKKTKQN